jgi:hypothetical protein
MSQSSPGAYTSPSQYAGAQPMQMGQPGGGYQGSPWQGMQGLFGGGGGGGMWGGRPTWQGSPYTG